jgi:hypothetical protein
VERARDDRDPRKTISKSRSDLSSHRGLTERLPPARRGLALAHCAHDLSDGGKALAPIEPPLEGEIPPQLVIREARGGGEQRERIGRGLGALERGVRAALLLQDRERKVDAALQIHEAHRHLRRQRPAHRDPLG